MVWLVVVHVLAAVIGLGPAYAFPLLLKKTGSLQEMERNLHYVAQLEIFPKVFGTLAVVTGLVLFFVGSYGTFLQIWIVGTLALYIVIEILVVGFLAPVAKKLHASLAARDSQESDDAPSGTIAMYVRARNLHLWASILSVVIFVLMVVKPH